MNFLQVNSQHAKAPSANIEREVSGLRTKSHKLLACSDVGRTRTFLVVRNELKVPIKTKGEAGRFWLISADRLPKDNGKQPHKLLRQTLKEPLQR